jgi:hypothetical protein
MPGTLVGALSAVMVGANEPTFTFSVGVKVAGDCEALLPAGSLVSAGFSLVSLPQAVMVAIPARAAAAANRATLELRRVAFTTYLLKVSLKSARRRACWRELYRVGFGSP